MPFSSVRHSCRKINVRVSLKVILIAFIWKSDALDYYKCINCQYLLHSGWNDQIV